MALGIDPKVDIVFKKLFGSEDNAFLLIDLLSAVVHPTRPITGLEIIQGQTEMGSPLDKLAIGDIRARDQGNRQFHVEMQRQVAWYFPKRLLYYWARFHPEQLRAGENYRTLRPTISICFVNEAIFPDVPEHHLIFRLREVTHDLTFSDDLELHLTELPKFTKTVEQLSGALDRWCYFLRHGAELDPEQLPASLDVPMIRRAMEVLTVFTQDERERAAYEQRLMYELDQRSLMEEVQEARAAKQEVTAARQEAATARQEAATAKQEATAAKQEATAAKQEAATAKQEVTAARQEATAAKERGVAMGQIRAYQEILKQPLATEAELLAMTQEDLASLLAQLRKQLSANGT